MTAEKVNTGGDPPKSANKEEEPTTNFCGVSTPLEAITVVPKAEKYHKFEAPKA